MLVMWLQVSQDSQTSYCKLSLVKTSQTFELDLGVCLCGAKRFGNRCGGEILVADCLSVGA